MLEVVQGEVIWRGRLTENGPPMKIVQNAWGQLLQDDAEDEVTEVSEPDNEVKPEAGMLF